MLNKYLKFTFLQAAGPLEAVDPEHEHEPGDLVEEAPPEFPGPVCFSLPASCLL